MPQIAANGVSLEYEVYGAEDAPVILLVMGLGAQLTLWPIEFVDALVAHGFRVIRHDNRDVGLSTKFDDAGLPDMAGVMMAAMSGQPAPIPYSLDDMAADAAALLEGLGIAKAHVVGASMGGMIVQLMAINHAEKLISMTSIMSTTGNQALPQGTPEAMAVLLNRPMSGTDEEIITYGMKVARTIGSPGYPAEETRLRERVASDYRRSYSPAGSARQFAAIVANGDRRTRLANVTVPTLVIHGEDDPLVPVDGGRDTAASIAGAELLTIPGMGHDVPLPLIPQIADAIAAFAAKAD